MNNLYYAKLLAVLDSFEEMGGPEHEEYIEVLTVFKAEMEKRIETAKRLIFEEQ